MARQNDGERVAVEEGGEGEGVSGGVQGDGCRKGRRRERKLVESGRGSVKRRSDGGKRRLPRYSLSDMMAKQLHKA